jgi:hypothetical protein
MDDDKSAPNAGWAALRAVILVVCLLLFISVAVLILQFDRSAEQKAQALHAMRSSFKGLEIAIKGYQTEYNRYPLATANADETPMLSEGKILKALMAEDSELNPKKVRFLDPYAARGGKGGYLVDSAGVPRMVDIYGQPYRICIDYDGDGTIRDPQSENKTQPETLSSGVIIWSGGKDGDPATWKDNLASWQ